MKKLSFLIALFLTMNLSACTSVPNPHVSMETTLGTIELELFADQVPETAKNFLELSKQGKYDGVPFHRVIKNFMIQGGDFTNKNGTGGESYLGAGKSLPDEFVSSLKNFRGTISMANKGPNTGTSQFFINLVDNAHLNGKHTVFGKVVKGMETVDRIADSKTGPNDRPLEEVLMTKVTVISSPQ